ncbi:NAD-dependent succinate-semialdehyde dehydrogenase [Klebsiella variicola subsp. variicola]|nr:NAD-dependent succinate-semialdehyde dehydrogenase [Klebsiella variicola subsp. variicola]
MLKAWHACVLSEIEGLALTISAEMGKPLQEARGEVRYAASFISLYAEEALRYGGDIFPSQTSEKRLASWHKPVGPVYAITPWNFPAAMITRKIAPALAAGCTAIVKPAEQSPLTALYLASLWEKVGGPAGTLQVLTTENPAEVSAVMFDDMRIRKLTFTGSTEVGKLLYQQSAKTMKRVSLELGGHAPFIIFQDADIAAAVREVIACKFRNAGQTCVCTNRIYVHCDIAEQFASQLASAADSLLVGDPLDESTQIGPIVDRQGYRKVLAHIDDAVTLGAKIIAGGTSLGGFFIKPTVITGVNENMRIMHEETFGPVAPITIFDDVKEVIKEANDSPYGLAAYIWTQNLTQAYLVTEALDYGMVGINDGAPSTAQAPFGGVKDSGLGREGGKWGLAEFLDVKFVSLRLERGCL